MAEITILEMKCENVTPDGMYRYLVERIEELEVEYSRLISMKRCSQWDEEESPKDSPGFKEEESPKDSSGWEEKAEEVAASEQGTSKGEDRSLPRSNKKCKRKFGGIEHMDTWMLLYLIVFGTFSSGANGKVEIERKPYRYISIATDETKVATNPVHTLKLHNYLIRARGGNYFGTYECTLYFLENNQSCSIVDGDNNQTECEGLRISGNETYTHLVVDGSKLTHDYTTFCIVERVPIRFILYTLGVSKKQDQVPEAVELSEASDYVTTSSIAATWTAPNGIVEYYDVSCPVGDPSPPTVNPSDNLTASCVNLTRPGDSYSLSVTTFSNGQRSETDTITITALPEAVELSEASDDVTTSSITATWTVPNGIVEYYDVSCPVGDPSPPKVNLSDNLAASCVNLPRPGDDYSISVTTFSYGQRSETDAITITASPKTNGYKVAFYFLLSINLIILLVIAIKKTIPCMHLLMVEEKSNETSTTSDTDQDVSYSALNQNRRNDSVA